MMIATCHGGFREGEEEDSRLWFIRGFLFQCSYAACYCEENVYKLCEAVRANSPASELDKSFAVFVSNK
jgi:hypothetical protein